MTDNKIIKQQQQQQKYKHNILGRWRVIKWNIEKSNSSNQAVSEIISLDLCSAEWSCWTLVHKVQY